MLDFKELFNSIPPHLKVRMGPSGIHIFNRSNGTNLLLDEVLAPKELWSKSPRHVSIALTNACDLNCSFCFVPKTESFVNYEILLGWLKELDQNGCLGIGFGGGEPTLYTNLVDVCVFVSKETCLSVTMTTHGHGLTNQLLDKLNGNINLIRISMDGVGKTYEFYRHRSFQALLEIIKSAKQITSVGLNYLVNAKTIKELDQALEIGHKTGISQFLLLPEEPTDESEGIDFETTILLKKWINDYKGSIPLAISDRFNEGFPICNPFEKENRLSEFVHIDAQGNLKRSSFDKKGIRIDNYGIIAAINKLRTSYQEDVYESMG